MTIYLVLTAYRQTGPGVTTHTDREAALADARWEELAGYRVSVVEVLCTAHKPQGRKIYGTGQPYLEVAA